MSSTPNFERPYRGCSRPCRPSGTRIDRKTIMDVINGLGVPTTSRADAADARLEQGIYDTSASTIQRKRANCWPTPVTTVRN